MIPREFQRSSLEAVLSGNFSRADANSLGLLCRSLALAAVRTRTALGRFCSRALVLNEDDVLQESFVQLFRRDGAGRFTEIERFFRRIEPMYLTASDEVLVLTLRRLVTVKVHSGIIAAYSKSDPSLCRMLRNLKLGLRRSTSFEVFQHFGDEYIRPCGIPLRLQLERIPLERVRAGISAKALAADRVPDMLRKLHGLLAEETGYQPVVPLVSLALLLRDTYAAENEVTDAHPASDRLDIDWLVEKICRRLHDRWYPKYVKAGKLDEDEFGYIVETIGSILRDPGSDNGSYFEHLKEKMPGLTREQYMQKHRTILEYLMKVARREAASALAE